MKRDRWMDELVSRLDLSEKDAAAKRAALEKDLQQPVRLIGIGQTGVGKTELLRAIFKISSGDLEDYNKLKTGAVRSVTRAFFSFVIENEEGFKVQFTDGPGLGESARIEEALFAAWVEEIPNHDLLYWVLDGSSRDVGHIQVNMKGILDATGYRDRIVVVLNKVDQILLSSGLVREICGCRRFSGNRGGIAIA